MRVVAGSRSSAPKPGEGPPIADRRVGTAEMEMMMMPLKPAGSLVGLFIGQTQFVAGPSCEPSCRAELFNRVDQQWAHLAIHTDDPDIIAVM